MSLPLLVSKELSYNVEAKFTFRYDNNIEDIVLCKVGDKIQVSYIDNSNKISVKIGVVTDIIIHLENRINVLNISDNLIGITLKVDSSSEFSSDKVTISDKAILTLKVLEDNIEDPDDKDPEEIDPEEPENPDKDPDEGEGEPIDPEDPDPENPDGGKDPEEVDPDPTDPEEVDPELEP